MFHIKSLSAKEEIMPFEPVQGISCETPADAVEFHWQLLSSNEKMAKYTQLEVVNKNSIFVKIDS